MYTTSEQYLRPVTVALLLYVCYIATPEHYTRPVVVPSYPYRSYVYERCCLLLIDISLSAVSGAAIDVCPTLALWCYAAVSGHVVYVTNMPPARVTATRKGAAADNRVIRETPTTTTNAISEQLHRRRFESVCRRNARLQIPHETTSGYMTVYLHAIILKHWRI